MGKLFEVIFDNAIKKAYKYKYYMECQVYGS